MWSPPENLENQWNIWENLWKSSNLYKPKDPKETLLDRCSTAVTGWTLSTLQSNIPSFRTRSCSKHCGAVGSSFMLCSSATPWNPRQFADGTNTEQIWTVLSWLVILGLAFAHITIFCIVDARWMIELRFWENNQMTFTSNQICLTLPNTTVLVLWYPIHRGFDWRRYTSSWWDTPQPPGEWRCRWGSGAWLSIAWNWTFRLRELI